MRYQTIIKSGKAKLLPEGLRCAAITEGVRSCNRLIVKKNNKNQVAGAFKCPRCSQSIEVEFHFIN